uniref:Uncharacterized protein n=1 Tax=Alexandrium andersonii TaxID=327968 RepID=A0A7S2HL34_9DINO|mmetsp:Transcript_72687/g.162732  ORF Transcript_72687/g.162732 Transcript_72687/m.162732 type:complete len:121 (+) Transcript_72687:1-363(+)
MAPGGGVGITSINRETSLPELITEVRKRHSQGPVCLGRPSMINYETTKARDKALRKSRPHLFWDSQRHIDRVRECQTTDPGFSLKLKPSMSAPNIGSIAKSAAGSSLYSELLRKQVGIQD